MEKVLEYGKKLESSSDGGWWLGSRNLAVTGGIPGGRAGVLPPLEYKDNLKFLEWGRTIL